MSKLGGHWDILRRDKDGDVEVSKMNVNIMSKLLYVNDKAKWYHP